MQNVTIKDFKAGQKAYRLMIPYTKGKEPHIAEVTIKSIGRKYVTLDDVWKTRYEECDNTYLRKEYSPEIEDYYLFLTEEAASEYLENRMLRRWLHNIEDTSEYSLEQLRIVKAILEPEKVETDEQKLIVLDGSADTVLELIGLLTKVPGDYSVSLPVWRYLKCMPGFSIAVDHVDKAILLDDPNWIEEHVDKINKEQERIDNM